MLEVSTRAASLAIAQQQAALEKRQSCLTLNIPVFQLPAT